jgi:2-polyprenyl-3-methyl-5-hydroxy-6-metoxy-1,4-benzoquinol methylase
MNDPARQAHWQNVYATRAATEVSWFQETPDISLDLVHAAGANPRSPIIDVGGGASRLVDALLGEGYADVTVLDISEQALAVAQSRLGGAAAKATWIVEDVTTWQPQRPYDIWHDRAAFHFLTGAEDRQAYVERLMLALRSGACAIIGTFAPDGPERCSGLPVTRYDAAKLRTVLGAGFELVESRRHDHRTPGGALQRFQFSLFRRR